MFVLGYLVISSMCESITILASIDSRISVRRILNHYLDTRTALYTRSQSRISGDRIRDRLSDARLMAISAPRSFQLKP